jgi:S-adenosylmethionine:tRNA ribosyltransferase-isomerase
VTALLAAEARPPEDLDFTVPPGREATVPAEARGLERDEVRMLVGYREEERIEHARLRDLTAYLSSADILVINTSATIPAALRGRRDDGTEIWIHVSTRLPYDLWSLELRPGETVTDRTYLEGVRGETIEIPGAARVEILAPYADGSRLWLARAHIPGDPLKFLAEHGSPIRYGHVDRDLPIEVYQTVYATEPGSAEMPSAGRGFTTSLVTGLIARGVTIAPIVLHTGVSSLEAHEPPYAEQYNVPVETARRVNEAKSAGGRVVAVGTTSVRALESVTDPRGEVHPGAGWTELVITPESGVRIVDGLLTGWHEPHASHLQLVEAIAGRRLLALSYGGALRGGYLWHEFGDLLLILPEDRTPPGTDHHPA